MLLEREAELTLLDELLEAVSSNGGKVVLIRGESGIGKSSLVGRFTADHSDDARVYFGSCDDLLTPQPLGPLWDIARDEPSLLQPLQEGDRRAVHTVFLDLLTTSLRPTIVVIEDTQWADEATLDVIKYVGRRIARTGGLLLLTYRDGEVDYDHPLRGVVGDLPPQSVERIQLSGLSLSGVVSLVSSSELDPEAVLSATDGNPFLVTEWAASGELTVPTSVHDSVMARVQKLSPGAIELLKAIAVIPERVSRDELRELVGEKDSELVECGKRGLLDQGDGYVWFHHELIRTAVEASLTTPERIAGHHKVLAGLPGDADPARFVHHARGADDVKSILEYAPKAARTAMAIGSLREARGHFRTLEPYLGLVGERERAGILDDRARNEFYLDNDESLDILNSAIKLHRSTGNDRALARALTFAVRVNEVNQRPDVAERSADEALSLLQSQPPDGDLAFALSQRAWLHMMRGESARALEAADRAVSLAEEIGDELSMIYALNTKGTELHLTGDAAGFQLLEEGRRRAALRGHSFEETRALTNMTSSAVDLRQLNRAADLALRARETAARHEIRVLESYAKAQYAEILLLQGKWPAARDSAIDALGSHPHVELLANEVLATLQIRQGGVGGPVTLSQLWAEAQASGETQHRLPAASVLAEAMWLSGEVDADLIPALGEVLKLALRHKNAWPGGALAFWLWKLGDLSDIPNRIAEPFRLVMEGDPEGAAEIWSTIGCPYEKAIALTHGDETSRLEAVGILDDLGASTVAAKLRKELRDEGVSVPRGKAQATRGHAAGLTARQAEVLQLLDQGLSNIEIADRLFLSPRTVENHVSAVLAKLGASTREEAVSRARREGFLSDTE